MGLLINEEIYINFKMRQLKRLSRKRTEVIIKEDGIKETLDIKDESGNVIYDDIFNVDVWLQIFPNQIDKDNYISHHLSFDMPYQEQVSDSDIYNLLKQEIIQIKDGFGRDIELDLSTAEDLI